MTQFRLFEYPLLLREQYLDSFGHVNNAAYLQIFEEARWELLSNAGYTMEHALASGLGFAILEANVRFARELRLRQAIIVRSQVQSYAGKVCKLRQWMVDPEGTIYCDALMTAGAFDLKTRRLARPTPEWLRALGIEGESAAAT